MIAGRRLSPALRSLSLAVVVTLVASACASGTAERARREAEAAELRARLDALDKSQDALTREVGRLATLIKAIDAQQAFLVAEAVESTEDRARVQKALDQSESALRELRAALEEARRRAAAAPGRGAPPPTSRETSADKLFAAAMASVRAEEYGQALLELSEVIDRFPKHALASTAQYWIGEARYRQRDFRQALVDFRKVVVEYPRSPQVPEALLKIGLCHRALKDTARARDSWELLAKDYAATTAGTEARSLLSELAGAPRRSR